jgi:hypothetical protein
MPFLFWDVEERRKATERSDKSEAWRITGLALPEGEATGRKRVAGLRAAFFALESRRRMG